MSSLAYGRWFVTQQCTSPFGTSNPIFVVVCVPPNPCCFFLGGGGAVAWASGAPQVSHWVGVGCRHCCWIHLSCCQARVGGHCCVKLGAHPMQCRCRSFHNAGEKGILREYSGGRFDQMK